MPNPMKIRAFKNIQDNKYRVTVVTEDFSSDEIRRMNEQGEPRANVGGDFEGPPEFDLPGKQVLVQSGFDGVGYTISFDLDDFEDAKLRANVWLEAVQERILKRGAHDFLKKT